MHSCLTVQEILANIFASYSHADTSEASTGIRKYFLNDRRTLARLARTCKAFLEPALDVLWHTQTSIEPLVRCLPSDVLKIDKERETLLHIKRDLLPSDFERMHYYSSRIRAWDEGYTLSEIDDRVIPLIWSRRDSPDPLLPMLKHVRNLSLENFLDMCFFPRMIIGPKLHSIHITVNEWTFYEGDLECPWDNLASVLKVVATSLIEFRINTDYRIDSSLDCGNLMSLFQDFSSIRTLNIHRIDIDHTTFAHLASLLHLESLNVAIDHTELTKFLARPQDLMAFPKLQELALQTDNLVNCTKLFELGCFRSLRSLEIMRLIEHGFWDLAPFFRSLQNHQSHSELCTLRILGDGHLTKDENVPRVAKITPSTLEPLLLFHNLADFQITLDGTFTLNDEFLMKMGTAFSKLRILHLFERSRRRAPKITLSGFLSFATQCAELTEVTLRMDALKTPSFHTFGEIVPHSALRILDVATSPAECESAMIAVLTVAFPGLSRLSYGWYYYNPYDVAVAMPLTPIDEEYSKCWKNVKGSMEFATRYYY